MNTYDIGIHIRRRDNVRSIQKSPTRLFIQAIQQTLDINPQTRFYLASDDEKEKEYLSQMREFYKKIDKSDTQQEKIEINGIKVSKKLLNRESLQSCPVCGSFPKKSMDDVCFVKFDCCFECYVKYVEGREERWQKGWRPDNGNSL